MQSFSANGKLLLSGEYLVLQGALALATPCKFGQDLKIEKTDTSSLVWQSLKQDGSIWIQEEFSKTILQSKLNSNDSVLAQTLKNALSANPDFIHELLNKKVTTQLQFPTEWGLGSSSTLIHLIAKWSNTNAIAINSKVTGGSGYDIACAESHRPILFRNDEEGAVWNMVNFNPPAQEQLFFIYLNKKSNSKEAVKKFIAEKKDFKEEIETISEISEALLFCDVFEDFIVLLQEHEEVMQYVLQEEKIQSAMFSDFPGVVKSLGAWGGDFILAAANIAPTEIRSYFHKKGFDTILNYNEMVLFT